MTRSRRPEAEQAAAVLARVSKGEGEEVEPLPDLKESLWSMRLLMRLALPYTTDWYCAQSWGATATARLQGAESGQFCE